MSKINLYPEGYKDFFLPPHTNCSATILGSGATLYEDYGRLPNHGVIFAVNDIAMYFAKPIQYLASMHPENFSAWLHLRKKQNFQDFDVKRVTCIPNFETDIFLPFKITYMSGTSALFATCAALEMGCNPVYLCGVPLDNTPRMFDPPWHNQFDFSSSVILDSWRFMRDNYFAGRVISMSGNSQRLLTGEI